MSVIANLRRMSGLELAVWSFGVIAAVSLIGVDVVAPWNWYARPSRVERPSEPPASEPIRREPSVTRPLDDTLYELRLRDLRPICAKYAVARQECATASSYTRCMVIKMGTDDRKTGICGDDGEPLIPKGEEVPSSLYCFWLRHF